MPEGYGGTGRSNKRQDHGAEKGARGRQEETRREQTEGQIRGADEVREVKREEA